jgi:hypothetical protein
MNTITWYRLLILAAVLGSLCLHLYAGKQKEKIAIMMCEIQFNTNITTFRIPGQEIYKKCINDDYCIYKYLGRFPDILCNKIPNFPPHYPNWVECRCFMKVGQPATIDVDHGLSGLWNLVWYISYLSVMACFLFYLRILAPQHI